MEYTRFFKDYLILYYFQILIIFTILGYVRYINEKREEIRKRNPALSAVEITKLLAEEWNKMTEDDKKPYLEAADLDKKRYYKEVGEYREAKKALEAEEKEQEKLQKKLEKQTKKDEISSTKPILTNNSHTLTNGNKDSPPPASASRTRNGEIPIFTDEFLEHNKVIDSELRLLRKSNTDYEQQNAVLEKHVENMQNGIDKLESEIVAIRENNTMLESYIDKLKIKLANAFSSLSLPGNIF